MSSEKCLVFYGLRFELNENDISAMEGRTHKYFVQARQSKLKCYWANFGQPDELYYVFLGREIASVGVDRKVYESIDKAFFMEIANDVDEKLHQLGYEEHPLLHLQWHYDI